MNEFKEACAIAAVKCYEDGLSVPEIAKSAKKSTAVVYKWLKNAGSIKRRRARRKCQVGTVGYPGRGKLLCGCQKRTSIGVCLMKVLSVRMKDEYLEIKAEVNKGGWVQTLTWYYSPCYRGHHERLDSDVDMKNPIGELLANLLIPGNRLDLELDDDSRKAVEEMEEKL